MQKRFDKIRIFYIVMTFLIAFLIFFVSSISSFPVAQKVGFDISTIYHFGVFFMLTFFLTLSLTNKRINRKIILITLLISIIYALSDEFHQLFVPGRFCSIKDALIDSAGSLFSVLILKIVERFNRL